MALHGAAYAGRTCTALWSKLSGSRIQMCRPDAGHSSRGLQEVLRGPARVPHGRQEGRPYQLSTPQYTHRAGGFEDHARHFRSAPDFCQPQLGLQLVLHDVGTGQVFMQYLGPGHEEHATIPHRRGTQAAPA